MTDEILEVKPPPPDDKELKSEKIEKADKDEVPEIKAYKDDVKHEAKEDKDGKDSTDKAFQSEAVFSDPSAFGRESLLAHAKALEQTARVLRHFIEQSERPNLRRGALKDEPDQDG